MTLPDKLLATLRSRPYHILHGLIEQKIIALQEESKSLPEYSINLRTRFQERQEELERISRDLQDLLG